MAKNVSLMRLYAQAIQMIKLMRKAD